MRSTTILAVMVGATIAGACKSESNDHQETAAMKTAEDHAEAELPRIRIAGIPDESPAALTRKYKPLVEYLSTKLGAKVEYVPLVDYAAAVHGLVANKIDFAWLGGFTFVQARSLVGAVPLVQRDIDREFKTVFIANARSKITKMEEIKGKRFAFGSRSSTSGHLMPRHFLMAIYDVDPDKDFDGTPVYSGAHDATVKLVEAGRVDAGAVNIEVWDRMVREGKVDPSTVRLIWTTPAYVDYVWAARRGISDDLKKKFTDAFLSLDPENPQHREVLALQGATAFVPASNSDFDVLESIARAIGLIKQAPTFPNRSSENTRSSLPRNHAGRAAIVSRSRSLVWVATISPVWIETTSPRSAS